MSKQENKTVISQEAIIAFRSTILDWFRNSGKSYPWRETTSPYRILVAEMFLQRTQAKQVVPIYDLFMTRFPSPADLATANVAEIERLILPLGLKKRAKQLKEVALQLVQQYGGEVPADLVALMKLPGTGRYTANAVLVFAFGYRLPLVDANTVRILRRVFGVESPLQRPRMDPLLWNVLADMIPEGQGREFSWALIDFSNSVCTAGHPHCLDCPLSTLCISRGTEPR